MSKVYWEKQSEGRFCALHCVNSVLQGPVFTKQQLEKYGWDLDRKERDLMGNKSRCMDIQSLSASENVAGDGFFSVGVLQLCLQSKGFKAFPWSKESNRELLAEKGFICHQNEHWFAIRCVDKQWWNLNSLLASPHRIDTIVVSQMLSSLRNGGYSVLIVTGDWSRLPPATSSALGPLQYYGTAAEIAAQTKEESGSPSAVSSEKKEPTYALYAGVGNSLSGSTPTVKPVADGADDDLNAALEMSRIEAAQKDLKEPIPEPPADEANVIRIVLRMAGHGTATRRFSGDNCASDLFQWIAFEAAKYPIAPPINVRHEYCIGQMPVRRLRKTFEGRVQEESAGTAPTDDISSKNLSTMMQSSECFNLEL